MKKFFKIVLFELWFIPIGIFLLMCGVYFHFLGISNLESTNKIVDVFLTISALLMVVSALGQFQKGGTFIIGGVVQLIIMIGAFCALAFLTVLTQFYGVIRDIDDVYGSVVPEDEATRTHYPIDTSYRFQSVDLDSFETHEFIGVNFIIYSLPELGTYEYNLWLKSNVDGTVYLKAFEKNNNTPLSSDKLPNESSLIIESTNKAVKQFNSTSHFTIYETDLDPFYATRFEVWFIPKDGEEEVKVIERNYQIEGIKKQID